MSSVSIPAGDSIEDPGELALVPPEPPAPLEPERAAPAATSESLAFVDPDTRVMLELVGRGLASEADEATRASARELWAQLAQTLGSRSALAMPPAPMAFASTGRPIPMAASMTMTPTLPAPTSPITSAARALRQLPPEQLLDLLLQRLRAALPAGATVPAPKGIQFQLVPVTPPSASK